MTNTARGEVQHTFLKAGKKVPVDFSMTIQATQMLKQMDGEELEENLDMMFKVLAAMTLGTMTEKTAEQMAELPISIVEFQDIIQKVRDATAGATKGNRQQRRANQSGKKPGKPKTPRKRATKK